MNYAFLDTCSWIDLASGRNATGKLDFSKANESLINKIQDLVDGGRLILLKNEIVQGEFNSATIDQLVDGYEKTVIGSLKNKLESSVIDHCDNPNLRKMLRQVIFQLDDVVDSFESKSLANNEKVYGLFQSAKLINVSELLKQKALTESIRKEHLMFRGRQNNVNDFLILYSIQEWIEGHHDLGNLDESSTEHVIYFITRNEKDFFIDSKYAFSPELEISQLVKPRKSLHDLPTEISKRNNESRDFLINHQSRLELIPEPKTNEQIAVDQLERLIALKKEFLLSFMKRQLSEISKAAHLKYLVEFRPVSYNTSDEYLPIIRSQNITEKGLDEAAIRASQNTNPYSETTYGDLLIVGVGPKSGQYVMNYLKHKIRVHNSIHVLSPNNELVIPEFLNYALKFARLESYAYNIPTIPRLSISDIRKIKIKLPPLEKQREFISLFQVKQSELERDIQGVKQKINMLLV